MSLVINLDDREDRWNESVKQFDKLEFIPLRHRATNFKEAAILGSGYLPERVAACNYSHRGAWSEFLNSGAKYLVVLEDDFVVNSRITLDVVNLLESQNLDFLQIGYITSSLQERIFIRYENCRDGLLKLVVYLDKLFHFKLKIVDEKLLLQERIGLKRNIVLNSAAAGTHAYILNRKIATELLKLNQPMFLSADDFFMALSRMRIFRMARLSKSMVSQSNSQSSIRV